MKSWRTLRGMPREIWILFVATLVNRAGTMVLPFLVLYLTTSLHFSVERAGFILAIYGIGALIAAPLSGALCDKYGGYRIMRESLLVTGVILALIPFFKTYLGVSVIVFMMALANETFRPAILAYMSLVVPVEQRKPAFSLIRLSINLGMSIGPAVGGFLAGVSFFWLFVIDALTSITAGVFLALSGLRDVKPEAIHSSHPDARQSMSALRDPRFLLYFGALLPIAFVFFQHISAMPLFMVKHLHLPEQVYGLMFTLNTLMIVFIEVPLNVSTSHWSYRLTIVLGCILFAVGFGGLAFVHTLAGVAATVVIWTFGEMILFPSSSAYIAHIARPGKQGQYMGLYTMSWGVAFAAGPWFGTYLLEHFGGRATWLTMLAFGLVSAALMAIIVSNEEIVKKHEGSKAQSLHED